jgi:UDP-N-acetylglucosamine:LPS N-acetylglucosamine transferase
MNTPVETAISQQHVARTAKVSQAKSKTKTYMLLFMGWTLLIATGALGAKLYTDHLRQQIAAEISKQTELQLQTVQDDYQKQITVLKDSVTGDLSKMQGKIDSINELLAFTKDSANSKTDNSNQLYTQLGEVKKKLDELKKNLDVLQ